ncbi:MAG: hypothetical protein OEY67_05680 [Gammaproteobacteria bacterium]|nr:hypothetical protein [Gammaproteobacteria bacterium]
MHLGLPGAPGLIALICAAVASSIAYGDWRGNISAEHRFFPEQSLFPEQYNSYTSVAIEPEYRRQWQDGKNLFTFLPFARLDNHDKERSHNDIRELSYISALDGYEWRVGIRKVFWGVAESRHLIDIINQTDLVEDPDEEDKLGQPMVNLAIIRDWGTIDIFVLPYFRERTFPGNAGRLRTPYAIDEDYPLFESDQEQRHIDGALRWSHNLGDWDLGLAYFSGTNREPILIADPAGSPALVPFYGLISQVSLDIQATKGAWLWKLEALQRKESSSQFEAAVGGLEYSFYGLLGSPMDLGIITEYLYDNRPNGTVFDDDVMVGLRLALNDTQSTELLAGMISDRNDDTRMLTLEASRRIGGHWKLELIARKFDSTALTNSLYWLRQDDYIQFTLGYYF